MKKAEWLRQGRPKWDCVECRRTIDGPSQCSFVCERCFSLSAREVAKKLLKMTNINGGGGRSDWTECNRCGASGNDIRRMVHLVAAAVLRGTK